MLAGLECNSCGGNITSHALICYMRTIKNIDVLITFIKKVIIQTLSLTDDSKIGTYNEICDTYFKIFIQNTKTQGLKEAVNIAKEMRLCVTRYLSGDPIMVSKKLIGLDKTGFPKKYKIFKKLDFNNPHDLRFMFTILGATRYIVSDSVKPDIEAITSPSTANIDNITSYEIRKSLRQLIPRKLVSSISTTANAFHTSSKTAPNFNGALPSSIFEARLIDQKYPDLLQNIKTLSGDFVYNNLKVVAAYTGGVHDEFITRKDNLDLISRVTSIPDKELKTRVIAILDYWSQASLVPLHDSLLNVLRNIKQDMTYNQSNFDTKSILGRKVYSFDLTSATDRFPISFQKLVLNHLIGENKSEAWSNILIQREYMILNGKKRKSIKYNCGQPLGAYSSWAVFTICHHVLVNIAILRAMKPINCNKDCYRLLGDDIIIYDDSVALEYQNLMKQLGVEISPSKTHVSKEMFELAKRWFRIIDGTYVEITGFPLAGVVSSAKLPQTTASYISGAIQHGWKEYEDILVNPNTIRLFVKSLGYRPDKQYLKDFYYTLYGINRHSDAKRFSDFFINHKPYCETDNTRYEKLISEYYMLAAIEQLIISQKNAQSIKVWKVTQNMSRHLKIWFGANGKAVSSFVRDNDPSLSFPHIQIWSEKINLYRESYNRLVHKLSSINPSEPKDTLTYLDDIFNVKSTDEGSLSKILSNPRLDKINRVSRNQEVLAVRVKMTRTILKNMMLGDISKTYENIIKMFSS
jgi:hypothetical protein